MPNIRSLVENKNKLDYKELTLSLVQEFGIRDKVEWDSVIPSQVQKDLFGGETLRLFKDHESFANQKDIRAIHRSKGETSQLLILSAILNDEKLSKQTIVRITKKFIGGQSAERYVVWFLGNPQHSVYKVVLSGREGKKVVLKTLPFAVDQPYYKTYDFILNEVNSKVNKFFVEPNELWKALWKAFDISVVNKQFYNDIKISFTDLVENVLAKSFIKEIDVKKHFAIRLIGRIIFSWFLKKKGIISDDVLSSTATNNYTNYYKELLEKLFFDVFNTPFKDRKKTLPDEIKNYPFLNGGLFEDQKDDFKDNYQLFLPNEWFYNLFNNTLEKYNFTIDENTSSNAEIAIDPEMLGRIFENLLAEQNPETQESARKATGSYYTPREIVDYMVEQSLIEYIKSNINKDVILNETKWSEESLNQKIYDFVHTEEFPEELKSYSKEILSKLNSIKILDPACGSGAFPIGMLQKLITIKQLILSSLPKGETSTSKEDIYNLKLQTILNSIYGCDIQPMAVELSRLRCWLSLIIDEPVDKKKDNWGIANLPNLDFKFVCVNTLISLPEFSASFGISEEEFNKLKSLREEYFTASAKRKEKIEDEFKEEQKAIAEKHNEWARKDSKAVQMLVNWNPFDISETPWFDPFWMFGLNDGFDIVIANPPYITIRNQDKELKHYIKNNFKYSRSADIYVAFLEKGISLLKDNANIIYIIPNKFFGADYGKDIRAYLAKGYVEINFIWDLKDEKIFDALISTIVFSLLKRSPQNPTRLLQNDENILVDNIFDATGKIQIEANSDDNVIIKKLNRATRLSDFSEIRTGIMGFEYWKMEPIISSNGNINNKKTRIYTNGNFNRYVDNWGSERINLYKKKYTRPTIELSLDYLNDNTIKLFKTSPKILVRGVSQKVAAILDEIGSGLLVAVHSIIPDKTSDIKWLLGIINSRLINWYHLKTIYSIRIPQGSLKYPVSFFQNLPIKKPENKESYTLLVDKIISNKLIDPNTNTKELEDKIDIMVYKLYSLTFDEVKIIDPDIEKIISEEEYEKFEIG